MSKRPTMADKVYSITRESHAPLTQWAALDNSPEARRARAIRAGRNSAATRARQRRERDAGAK
jgi:hypothetical protein